MAEPPRKLVEYQGWPKGIYPMSDGWVPPAYPTEEELVAYENKMNSRRKAVLVKRHVCVKDPEYERLSSIESLRKGEYSMLCMPIMEGPYSGEGEDRTWFLAVFYETAKKTKVERMFRSFNWDITEIEQVPVDPDDCQDWEKELMYDHGAGKFRAIVSECEYAVCEKGTPEYEDPWGPKFAEGPRWE
mmetsp:Transcript_7439/g.16789  ORF Transcript_7439/g.16789 Transcript_7439/m.16789 type:complete len:187 (+) Transcript_7439:80-640(+)|eukprot:CAMPEP_0206438966 /NCGR_PEP_ID=MMETSP0324_2-20121206/11939_1 /ASSEMBLY_ACC=CAM_ASM_000836 /TAXON_ID=2866 /ORGANISM="Crypthecodinium cohnii, Strain Seligo" /LENGTH=186 /DNA_ID=CAMNT_0053906515 /DNA_START=15 /DNA_END=575 /DNA_ORIENTATION=-